MSKAEKERMYNATSASIWTQNQEKALAEVPCQNCGRMVTILVPFVGCVFCGDCMRNDTGLNDGTEDFYDKRRLE